MKRQPTTVIDISNPSKKMKSYHFYAHGEKRRVFHGPKKQKVLPEPVKNGFTLPWIYYGNGPHVQLDFQKVNDLIQKGVILENGAIPEDGTSVYISPSNIYLAQLDDRIRKRVKTLTAQDMQFFDVDPIVDFCLINVNTTLNIDFTFDDLEKNQKDQIADCLIANIQGTLHELTYNHCQKQLASLHGYQWKRFVKAQLKWQVRDDLKND